MAQELGTGYIIISPSTKGLGKAIEGSIGEGTNSGTQKSSKTLLQRIGGAFGKIGKIVIAATGAIGGALVGLAAKGGFDRALNIERAQTKLKALGHDTKSVDGIMNDALASVKGTAFGLGDAASVAAGLVASGVKQGGQLQTVLKTVGDTAQIAGVEFKDMGVIFGKVAATGKLQGDEMLQLMEAGIPVLQYLADHFQVTAEEAQKMVSDGKVSFEDFEAAMREHLGGAAKSAGDSFDGMLANIKAAFSRTGETIATPLINSMTQLGNKAIPIIDQIGGKVGELASQFTDRLAGAVDVIGGKMDEFSKKLETGEITIDDLIRKLGELAGGFTVLAAVGGNLDTIMGAFDQLGSITDGAASKVKSGIDNIKNAFMNGMDSLGTFKSLFNKDIRESMIIDGSPEAQAVDRITNGLGRIRDGLKNGLDKLGGHISSGFKKVHNGLVSKMADLAFSFENNPVVLSVKSFGGKVKDALEPVASAMHSFGGKLSNGLSLGFGKVCDGISSFGGKMASGISSMTGKLKTALAPVGEVFGGLGQIVGPKLQSGFSAIGGMIGSFFSPANFMKFVGVGGIIAALVAGLGMINESTGGKVSEWISGLGEKISQITPMVMSWIQTQLPTFIQSGAQMIQSLLQGLTSSLPALATIAGEFVNTLCSGLGSALPALIPAAVQMVTTLVTSLVDQIPTIITAGMNLLDGLVQGVMNAVPTLIAAIPTILDSLIAAFSTALPQIMEQGVQIIENLIDGLLQAMPQIIDQIPRIITILVNGLSQNLPQLIQSGIEVILKLIDGLTQAIPQLAQYIPQIVEAIVTALVENLPTLIEAGIQIIVMLVRGLIEGIPKLLECAGTLLMSLGQAFLDSLPALLMVFPQIIAAIVEQFTGIDLFQVGSDLMTKLGEGLSAAWQWVCETISAIGEWFTTLWQSICDGAKNIWNSLGEWFASLWQSISDTATAAWDAFTVWISGMWNGIVSTAQGIWNGFLSFITGLWNNIKNAVSNAINAVSSTIGSVLSAISVVWNSIWNGIRVFASSVWNGIKSVVSGAINGVKSTISSVLNGIKGVWDNIWNGIRNGIGAIWNGIKTGVSNGINAVMNTVRGIKDSILGFFSGAGSWLIESGRSILNGLKDGIMSGVNAVKDAVGGAIQSIRNLFPFSPAKEGPFSGHGWVLYSGMSIMEAMGDGIRARTKSAVNEASKSAHSIYDALNTGKPLVGIDVDAALNSARQRFAAEFMPTASTMDARNITYNIQIDGARVASDERLLHLLDELVDAVGATVKAR